MAVSIPSSPPEPPPGCDPLLAKLIRYGCPNCAQKLHASQWTRIEAQYLWHCGNCLISHTDEFIDTFGGNDFEHAFYEAQNRNKALKAEIVLLEQKLKSDSKYRQLEADLAHVKRQLSQKYIYESVVAGVVLLGKLIDDAQSTTDPETFDFKVGQLLTRLIEFSRESPYNENKAAPLRPILNELEGWELEAIEVSDLVDHALDLDDLEDHNPDPFPEAPKLSEFQKAVMDQTNLIKKQMVEQLQKTFPGTVSFSKPTVVWNESVNHINDEPMIVMWKTITGLDFGSDANGSHLHWMPKGISDFYLPTAQP